MIPKNVVLKLVSIRYFGKSIGDDIQIEIKILDQIFSTDITLNTGKNYKAIEHPSTPWKKGKYDIEIADTAHKGGEGYIDKAPKAKVWFRISHNYKEERYIHTGQRTAGCITLTEHEKWDEVYQVLIRARKGDLKSVGILEVID